MGEYFLGGAASGLVTQGLSHGLSGFGTNHLMAGISTLDGIMLETSQKMVY